MSTPKPGLRDRAGLAAAHTLVDDPRRANTFLERDHFAKGAP